jgi:hypothetical protein
VQRENQTYSKERFLIFQTLLFLLSELIQAVIVSVEIDKFVISLNAGLADLFADFV